MGRAHWLIGVLERAGESIDPAAIPADFNSLEAWRAACARVAGLTPHKLADLVAKHFRLRVADLGAADPTAARLVSGSVIRDHLVAPLRSDYHHLVVATSDPTDVEAEQALAFASGRRTIFEIAPPADIERHITAASDGDWVFDNLLKSLGGEGAERIHVVAEAPTTDGASMVEWDTQPVVEITDRILDRAIELGASDIHIGPGAHGGSVRFRIDGALRTIMAVPLPAMNRIISRVKVLGSLDIADRVRPQDGKARIRVAERTYDLRVSSVPTRGTEKAVIRILDPETTHSLDDLEFPADVVGALRRLLSNRDGVVVVTGPTGSGKTTTLYAGLTEIATGEVNAMTAEDPVEYHLPCATQIEINERQGVTFPSALRAMLRQDPDVILVGEVRDKETGDMALRASMTGHLVLTTVHANDAAGVVNRLVDLGLNPAIISSTLRGALAQRLVRRICPYCHTRVEGELTADERRLAEIYDVRPIVRASRCSECGETGYKGRLPIVEVFDVTSEIERLIARGAPHADLRTAAINGGMRPMIARAQDLVRAGLTTLEEVSRVLGEDVAEDEAEATAGAATVLVVDDDPIVRGIVRVVLEGAGFHVDDVDDGVNALRRVQAGQQYSLVIMDLQMPRMTGEEALEAIRSHPRTAGLPVIVLTASVQADVEARVLGLGADDYIRKPIDPQEFTARVMAVLARFGVLPTTAAPSEAGA